MSEHTPGPWKPDWNYVIDDNGSEICQVFNGKDDQNLIASAPDLLAALEELRDWYQKTTGLPAVNANAAIAKARGGKS